MRLKKLRVMASLARDALVFRAKESQDVSHFHLTGLGRKPCYRGRKRLVISLAPSFERPRSCLCLSLRSEIAWFVIAAALPS